MDNPEKSRNKYRKKGKTPSPLDLVGSDYGSKAVPFFDAAKAAAFAQMKLNSGMVGVNLDMYRQKIYMDFLELLARDFDTFIVSYGSNYGMLALEALLSFKKSGRIFTLIGGKLFGERQTIQVDPAKEFQLIIQCDQRFSPLVEGEFLEQVISKVSAISSESILQFNNQKIPEEMQQYYSGRCQNPFF